MKIAIIGCGAIGGFVGAKLADAGEEVTFIARGTSLEALRTHGIRLSLHDGAELKVRDVRATDDYLAAGTQDLVVLAVKAHQLGPLCAQVPRLFRPDTAVVTMQNGIPYWYFHRHGGALAGTVLESVDPGGHIGRAIPAERVIGCVVYPAAELTAPGVVRQIEGDRFPVGEPDGSESARVQRISRCFTGAGFKCPVLADVRAEIWLKLWGNLTFNPISALARATLADICQNPRTRALAAAMMTEAQTIAQKLGITFRVPLERRIAGAEKVGHHKTSMLQDLEAGRPLELDALLGSVAELARLTDTPVPNIDAVYALTQLLARTAVGASPAQELRARGSGAGSGTA
jgi:2-dehydropantoate 2-reductase